jgi:uncharacterized protein (DUF983 family)
MARDRDPRPSAHASIFSVPVARWRAGPAVLVVVAVTPVVVAMALLVPAEVTPVIN